MISDIHCNIAALEAALAMMAPEVDEIFVAGDVIYEYRFSNDVVGLLQREKLPCVLGNHDGTFLGPGGVRARAAAGVSRDLVSWVSTWPKRLDAVVAKRRIVMIHGAPWPPHDRYLTPNDGDWSRCAELDADVLLTGHTHIPMVKRAGDALIVNPGSLGESREPGARDLVSYALVDLASCEAEIVRFPNPR